MPNVNDLQTFVKATNVFDGDLIHFCDAGRIFEKEFEDKQTRVKKVQDVLEMEVMINDEMKKKIYSPNAVSRQLLADAWGPDTESWVGKSGIVSLVEQLSFGKLTKILIVKPVTVSSRTQGRPAPVAAPVPAPANQVGPACGAHGQVINPEDIQWDNN